MNRSEIRSFRKSVRGFERELAKQSQTACCCGVSISQCHVLMELDSNEGISLKSLADRLDLDKSTVSRTVESLVNLGLLSRNIPQTNRRTILISLTSSGKKVIRTIHDGNDSFFKTVLGRMPENIRNSFIEGFQMMVESMKIQSSG